MIDFENILLVCYSDEWGVNERFLVNLIKLLSKYEVEIHLFCYKDSLLDLKLKENKANIRVYYTHRQSNIWYKTLAFKRFIKRFSIQIVHGFDAKSLIPLAVAVNSFPLVPLLYNDMNLQTKFKHNFLSRFYINRIDRIITSYYELFLFLSRKYNLHERKIENVGVFVRKNRRSRVNEEQGDILKKILFTEKDWAIGAYIPQTIEDKSSFDFLLDTFEHLQSQTVNKGKIALVVYSERDWDTFLFFGDLKNELLERKIENIHFVTERDSTSQFKDISLWIMLDKSEGLEERSVQALVNEVPVLAPRTEAVLKFNEANHLILETYHHNDARDLRKKILASIENIEHFKAKIVRYKKDLSPYRFNEEVLSEIYWRLLVRRKRHLQLDHRLS